MSIVYLLQNQHKQYLDKSGEWVSGENSRSLFRTEYKDEAINRKVEFSVKNFELRIAVFEAKAGLKGDIELAQEDIQPAQHDESTEFSLISPQPALHDEASPAANEDLDHAARPSMDPQNSDQEELLEDAKREEKDKQLCSPNENSPMQATH